MIFASMFLFSAFSSFAEPMADKPLPATEEYKEVPIYDFAWEDLDTDYDQICDEAEYEKPSALLVWFRSVGGVMYLGLCNAREYVAAKLLAIQKALWKSKHRVKVSHSPVPQDFGTNGE